MEDQYGVGDYPERVDCSVLNLEKRKCWYSGTWLLLQDEDSEEYGSPIALASAIADTIKSRTESLLKRSRAAVSSKPIVMRAEYAHCPNITIIDTPGFVLKVSNSIWHWTYNCSNSTHVFVVTDYMHLAGEEGWTRENTWWDFIHGEVTSQSAPSNYSVPSAEQCGMVLIFVAGYYSRDWSKL